MRSTLLIGVAMGAATAIVSLAGCAGRDAASPASNAMLPAASAARTRTARESWMTPAVTRTGGLVYVADSACNCIKIYRLDGRNQRPIGQIGSPSFSYIEALQVDPSGNLWVTNFGTGANIFEYPRGATTPSFTLSDPGYPSGIAFANGKIYIANLYDGTHGPGNVVIFANGASSPERTLSDPRVQGAIGIAVNAKGDVFIDTSNEPNRTLGEFEPSGTAYRYVQLAAPSNPTMYLNLMTLDAKQNIVASSQVPYSIVVFSQKGKMKRHFGGTYTGGDHFVGGPTSVAFDSTQKYLFAAYLNDFSVVEFDYSTGKVVDQIISGLTNPKAVAVSP